MYIVDFLNVVVPREVANRSTVDKPFDTVDRNRLGAGDELRSA
jgi:hypothetical protein